MSAKEHDKYHDDAVTIDDVEVKEIAQRCQSFRWEFPEEEHFLAEMREATTREAKTEHSVIVLNKHGYTPEMQSLVSSRLLRQTSNWVEIKTEFTRVLSPHSELLEETANIKEEKAQLEAKRKDLKQLLTREWEEKKKAFRDDRKEAADAEMEYDRLYEKHGNRHARIVNYWLYLPLLAVIGLAEVLINWEAANSLFAQPYLAAGIVMVIALAVAAASHEHGTLAKQWSYRCGFMADSATKYRNYTALGFTTLLFIAAMALVGYMRYKLAYEDLLGGAAFGGINPFGARGTMNEVYTAVGMTLMGNIIVWLLGAMVAYWVHDSNPHFAEARVRHIKASARFSNWSRRMEKVMREQEQNLTLQIEQLDNTRNSRVRQGRLLVDISEQVHEHEQMLFRRLKEIVDDSLLAYRRHLVAFVKAENPELKFADTNSRQLSVLEYESRELELPAEYLVERMEFGPFIERRAAKRRLVEEVA